MPRTASKRLEDLSPGDHVRGFVHACECCGTLFIASADARFCGNACRVKAKRQAKEQSEG